MGPLRRHRPVDDVCRLQVNRCVSSIGLLADLGSEIVRVPQILHSLSTITYSQHLTTLLNSHADLPNGSQEEVEIRCLSIAANEELRRAIVRLDEERLAAATEESPKSIKLPNAVLLDFLLWDLAKVEESRAELPHHRTRSVYY